MKILKLKEYRCNHCQKLLFKALIYRAIIEIKCRNCKGLNEITADTNN